MFKNLPGGRGFVFPKYEPVAIHGDPIQASGQPNLSDISPEDMSSVATEDISSGEISDNLGFPRPEWGHHGSPWAHTLGKRSHGLEEGF